MSLLRKSWGARDDRAPLSDAEDPDEIDEEEIDEIDESDEDEPDEDDLEDEEGDDEPGEHVEGDDLGDDVRGAPVVQHHTMLAIETAGSPLLYVPASHVMGRTFVHLEDFLPEDTRSEDLLSVKEVTGWFATKEGLDSDGDAIDWVGPFDTEAEAANTFKE